MVPDRWTDRRSGASLPTPSVCAFRCNRTSTKPGSAAGAARRRSGHDPSSRVHEGKRFPEIAESKCALDAAGFIAQLPIGSLRLEAQGLIAPQRRNAAATKRACFFGERLGHVLGSPPYLGSSGGRGSVRSPRTTCRSSRGSLKY